MHLSKHQIQVLKDVLLLNLRNLCSLFNWFILDNWHVSHFMRIVVKPKLGSIYFVFARKLPPLKIFSQNNIWFNLASKFRISNTSFVSLFLITPWFFFPYPFFLFCSLGPVRWSLCQVQTLYIIPENHWIIFLYFCVGIGCLYASKCFRGFSISLASEK